MADKIYSGDIGTLFRINCGVDISDATVTEIRIQKPDKTTVTWAATLDGTNYIVHTTVLADLQDVGTYKGQAYVVTPAGTWRGETFSFKVYDSFK